MHPQFTEPVDDSKEIGRISGKLPAGFDIQEGGEDTDGPHIEKDQESITFGEFILDSLVAAKRRCSTFKCTKKWSKEEDLNLMHAVKICKHNWQQIATKLEAQKGKNDSLKTPEDCKRRWMVLSKGMEY